MLTRSVKRTKAKPTRHSFAALRARGLRAQHTKIHNANDDVCRFDGPPRTTQQRTKRFAVVARVLRVCVFACVLIRPINDGWMAIGSRPRRGVSTTIAKPASPACPSSSSVSRTARVNETICCVCVHALEKVKCPGPANGDRPASVWLAPL